MKTPSTDSRDIATEPYRGPSALVAAAGYTYAGHLIAVIAGVFVAGVSAYAAHRHVNRAVGELRDYAAKNTGYGKKIVDFLFGMNPGKHPLKHALNEARCLSQHATAELHTLVTHEERGFFENLAFKVTKSAERSAWVSNFMQERPTERLSAAFIGGGLGGAVGWIGSTIWGILKGHGEGAQGVEQFERAKAEIKTLRQENTALRRASPLPEARSTAPERVSTPAADISAPSTTLAHTEHEGMVTAAPVMGVEPRVS